MNIIIQKIGQWAKHAGGDGVGAVRVGCPLLRPYGRVVGGGVWAGNEACPYSRGRRGGEVFAGCYNPSMLPDLTLDDVVRLRKPHPCGGYEWKVVRLGADIGLVCLTCSHKVLLTRRELNKRIKKFIATGDGRPIPTR